MVNNGFSILIGRRGGYIQKFVGYCLLALSLCGIFFSLYHLGTNAYEYKDSAEKYESLKRQFKLPSKQVVSNEETINYHSELKKINEDYVGWLTVDGTSIDYPVVLGKDNDFYLTRNFYKEEDRAGAIFMDYRNKGNGKDSHTIIYGHNMKDKSMFATLAQVLQDNESTNRILYEDPQGTSEWKIFSAYTTKDTDWMQVEFESEREFHSFIESLMKKSKYSYSLEVLPSDKILTLATCTNRHTDERIVVHAKRIEEDN